MKIKNTILTFLLSVLTVECNGTSGVANQGYMGSGYTKEELEEKGVNTRHLFVFTEHRATYNGRTFSIDIPIDSLIETFGPYERIVYKEGGNTGYNDYFWDEIGFVATVSPEKVVINFSLHWDYLPKEKEYDYDSPNPTEVPASFFKGKILLNGIPLDNTSDYAAYCNNEEVQNQLLELARKEGIRRNFHKCLYHYTDYGGIHRYEYSYHKLYFFDYTVFENDPLPFFSYRAKIATETGRMHEFGMQYDVYTNPNSIDIF